MRAVDRWRFAAFFVYFSDHIRRLLPNRVHAHPVVTIANDWADSMLAIHF
jgi:hypothetical protein